jgi:hypothetical protein
VRRVEDLTEALWGTRVSRHGIAPEPEDLPAHRGLEEPRHRRRLPPTFTWIEAPEVQDYSGAGGATWTLGAWNMDTSLAYGLNKMDSR